MHLSPRAVLALLGLVTMSTGACGRSLETVDDSQATQGPGPITSVGPGRGQGGEGPSSGQGGEGQGTGASGPSGTGGAGASGPSGTGASGPSGTGASGPSGSGGEGAGAGAGGPSGSSGGGSGGGPADCPGFGDVCTECIADDCSARWCACLDNPECLELFGCTNQCQSEPCLQACYVEHADGLSDAALVLDCAASSCGVECPGVEELPDCTECLYESCEDESNACVGEPECLALYDCLVVCNGSDLQCQAGCYDDHEGGIEPLQDLLECSEVECPEDCN